MSLAMLCRESGWMEDHLLLHPPRLSFAAETTKKLGSMGLLQSRFLICW